MANEALFQISTKAVILNEQQQILILHATPDEMKEIQGITGGYYDLPGGRVDKGELPEQTVLREAGEETGIHSFDSLSFFMAALAKVTVTIGSGEKVGVILFSYLCRVSGNPEITLGSEHDGFQWCSIAEAATLLSPNFPQAFLEELRQLA